jgi:serine/threonine-protein kinase
MKYGRYETLREVGRGSMGVVHEAYDPQIDRAVALKVLRPDYRADESSVLRFLREAKTIGRVSHPHIVTVYDAGEDRGTLFIAMEYIEGRPLGELMRERQFSREEILDIGIQVAETLDHAHGRGVVHRDIKPSNILVQPSGAIKITDFGIAHMEDSACTLQTREGEILGTPAFMSPEQVRGKPVDGRSDLFSLGVILYQLATGRRPFGERGSTLASLLNAIVHASPAEPAELRPDVDPRLGKVIMRCLRKEPEDRFPTGAALAEALQECRSREHGGSLKLLGGALHRHFSSIGFAHVFLVAVFSLAATLLYLFPPSAEVGGSPAGNPGRATAVPSLQAQPPVAVDSAEVDRKGSNPLALPLPLGEGRHSPRGGGEALQAEIMAAARGPGHRSAAEPRPPARAAPTQTFQGPPGAALVASRAAGESHHAAGPAMRSGVGGDRSVRERRGPESVSFEEGGEPAAGDPSVDPQVMGILEISSTPPGAEVLVDGASMGATPFVARIPPGERLVTVRSPDHDDWERRVSIEAGGEYPFEISMGKAEQESILAVVSEPSGAKVFVNGVEQGMTPSTLKLPPGEHTVKIKHRRFKEYEKQVVLARAEERTLKARLTPVQPKNRRAERRQPPPPDPVSSLVSQVRHQLSPNTLWRRVRNLF